MPVTLEDQLVVAISSRALFNFEEENRVFEQSDDRAYVQLQRERLQLPATPGVAFSLVKKLLAFNQGGQTHVEVVLLSRNDPVSGMRVFRSCQAHGLTNVQRGVFTQGRDPFHYLRPLGAHLFLSANEQDVRAALHLGYPAARVLTESVQAGDAHPHEVRIAFDGDAVLFSDEAERVYQSQGLQAFQQHESAKASQPLPDSVRATVIPGRQALSDTHGELIFARFDARNRLITGGAILLPFDRADRLKTAVAARIERLWPQIGPVRFDHIWNGYVGMTPDFMPRFHRLGPDAWAWAGCNGRAVGLSVALGGEFAKAVCGVPERELALPFTEPQPLPMHGIVRRVAPLMLLRYRRMDRTEI